MNTVKQISVTLLNTPGMLSAISDIMADNGIYILGLSTNNQGQECAVRFVVSDPEKAANVLKGAGYKVGETDILAAETPSHPGGLDAILKPLKAAGVNVEYLYAYIGGADRPILLLELDKLQEGAEALKRNWIKLHGAELYMM